MIDANGHEGLPTGVGNVLQEAAHALDALPSFAFTVADCSSPDMPICYASSSFYELTGYSPDEVIGRNCRFMQGPETARQQVMEIRDAIREDRSCHVCILNYKANGEKFWNQFYLAPVRDESGAVTHYVGIQADVTQLVDARASAAHAAEQAASTADVAAQLEAASPAASSGDGAAQGPDGGGQGEPDEAALAATALVEQDEAEMVQRAISAAHCCSNSALPSSLLQPLMRVQANFVLSDPNLPDSPIVFASNGFLQMTGYSREEVCGRNCRFLQGPGTDQQEVAKIRHALHADPPQPVTITLLNYRKDGTPFYNALHVAPIRDADGGLKFFIGVQLDIGQPEAVPEDSGAAAPAKLKLSHKMSHMGATGAVRVACRSLAGSSGGLRRSLDCQGLVKHGYASRRCTGNLSGASSGLARSTDSEDLGPRLASGPAAIGRELMEQRLGGSGAGGGGAGGSRLAAPAAPAVGQQHHSRHSSSPGQLQAGG